MEDNVTSCGHISFVTYDGLHQRRFPGSIGADKGMKFFWRNRKIESTKNMFTLDSEPKVLCEKQTHDLLRISDMSGVEHFGKQL